MFPDVVGCYFACDVDEDIYTQALTALKAHIETRVLNNVDLASSQSMSDHIRHKPADFVAGQWYNIMIDMTKFDKNLNGLM